MKARTVAAVAFIVLVIVSALALNNIGFPAKHWAALGGFLLFLIGGAITMGFEDRRQRARLAARQPEDPKVARANGAPLKPPSLIPYVTHDVGKPELWLGYMDAAGTFVPVVGPDPVPSSWQRLRGWP